MVLPLSNALPSYSLQNVVVKLGIEEKKIESFSSLKDVDKSSISTFASNDDAVKPLDLQDDWILKMIQALVNG